MFEIAANLAMTGIVREVREFRFVEKRRNMRRFISLSDAGGTHCAVFGKGGDRCVGPTHGARGRLPPVMA